MSARVGDIIDITVTALAAGGDGLGRDDSGRVTFIPRTAPGDRVRARIVHATKSFARAVIVELVAGSAERTTPPCPHFVTGCGGCQWQHVARPAQLAAKQAIVEGALRKLPGLRVHPIADPAPAYGWRRRARFHVVAGRLGLYAEGSRDLVAIDRCPQLVRRLDDVLALSAAARPPDGEIALVVGDRGGVSIGVEHPWPDGQQLVSSGAVHGLLVGDRAIGDPIVEVEPGLFGGPWEFAQASADGNARLIEIVRAAVGKGPGRLVELYAGAGNFTRHFAEDGWHVIAIEGAAAAHPVVSPQIDRRIGDVASVLSKVDGAVDVVVLDPPRSGAASALEGIVRLSPRIVVYISCDPATLGRDAERLVAAGYRGTDAWPVDVMPQTSHVEVVMAFAVA